MKKIYKKRFYESFLTKKFYYVSHGKKVKILRPKSKCLSINLG